jgi:hypothetical protein
MPLRPRHAFRPRALFAQLAAFALILSALVLAPAPAAAQNEFSDFFGSLFAPRHAAPPAAAHTHPARRPKPRAAAPEHERSPPSYQARPASQPASPPANRPAPTFFVAVVGDSLAGMLAQGLTEAFADDPRVEILNKAREDTGLVRDDFYDWRLAVRKLLDGPKHIDVAVIQIGINDNQKLHLGDVALEPLSKPFNEIYAKRVEEIATAFREKNVPLIWVGLPIMRSENLSTAALLFNDLDRQYGGALGAHYVDLWEPFTDLNSVYKATGPDVNGAVVRLRAADGVHFNKAGARKAAHFVEAEIRHVQASLQPAGAPAEGAPAQGLPAESAPSPLTPMPTPGQAPLATPEQPQPPEALKEPPPPPKPLAGKVQPLTEPAVSPGGGLAGLSAPHLAPPPGAAPTQPGRADDFSWPQKKLP